MGGGTDAGVGSQVPHRLIIRYERREDIHEAFLLLGCSLICLNHLS